MNIIMKKNIIKTVSNNEKTIPLNEEEEKEDNKATKIKKSKNIIKTLKCDIHLTNDEKNKILTLHHYAYLIRFPINTRK